MVRKKGLTHSLSRSSPHTATSTWEVRGYVSWTEGKEEKEQEKEAKKEEEKESKNNSSRFTKEAFLMFSIV
jgi:hypothetical protein